jgi:hypothetical protein
MNIIHRCWCGIDVHAKTVVVCLIKNGQEDGSNILDDD